MNELVVFAKAPRPGLVKTRLCPPFSPEQAAELYTQLLLDVLDGTARFCDELGLEPTLTVHPPDDLALEQVCTLAPRGFRVTAQCGADLGARMTWAAREAAARGARRILLRGSDSPLLDGSAVASVLAALDEVELAVTPDRDGGYSLIGMRAPVPGLFDHRMSTASVLEDTRERARERGLALRVLESSFDIDDVEDLNELMALSRSPDVTQLCPRTLTYLDQLQAAEGLASPRGPC